MPGKNAYDRNRKKKKNKKSYIAFFTESERKSEKKTSYVYRDDLSVRTLTKRSEREAMFNSEEFHPERMQIYEVTQHLNTDTEQGLTRKQILRSYERNGKNSVFPEYRRSFSDSMKQQFLGITPVIYLLACLLIYIFNKETPYLVSSAVMLLIMIADSVFNVAASGCFKEVNKIASLKTTVVRQGKIFVIDSSALVPGDIVILSSGTVVPADIRLCESNMLYALETPITGAEESVQKDAMSIEEEGIKQTYKNMVYAGTIIRSGQGTGIVCFTSDNVKIRKQKKNPTFELLPDLLKYSAEIRNRITLTASVLCFVFLLSGLLFKRDIVSLFMCGASISASLIPEIANSLSALSFGKKIKKMLRSGAAVKNLNCIAPLCSIDSIMCGKRSAFPVISANVKTIFADGAEFGESKSNETVIKLLSYALVCSEIKRSISRTKKGKEMVYNGSQTEMAIIAACNKLGIDIEDIKKSYFKIESDDMRSTESYRTLALHDNRNYFIMKGSPEYVLSYCTKYRSKGEPMSLDAKAKRALMNVARRMTEDSQYVIAIASCETHAESLGNPSVARDVEFNGFIGIYMSFDLKSASAVLKCANSGIETVLKTPDDHETAVRMAKNSSILQDEKCVVSSEQISEMGYDRYRENVLLYKVYLHPTDEQWMQTLKLRKSNGKKVLFTGERIDELKMMNVSDVSTSLSSESNDTLRQSADVIMQSGGVNVISDLISYAKTLYESIFTISSHAVSLFTLLMLTFIIPVTVNYGFPFRIDILIPFISVSFMILMIPACFVSPSKDILSRKTEQYSKRFKAGEYIMPIIYGSANFAVITAVFLIGKSSVSITQAQTMAFISLIVSMILMSSMRSYKCSVLKRSNAAKILFPAAIICVLLINASLILIPSVSAMLELALPPVSSIMISIAAPTAVFIVFQIIVSVMKLDTLKGKREKQKK